MSIVEVRNVGSVGIIKDVPDYQLPLEAWSDGQNMRFYAGQASRALGQSAVFGTPSAAPGFILNVPGSGNNSYWIYTNLTDAYVFDGAAHSKITRSVGGVYAATDYRFWNGCILGGIPIINDFADIPQYWPALNPATTLANLPNWPSTLQAKIIRNFGQFLVALNLIDTGSALPHAVQWSNEASPGSIPNSWSLSDPTIDAGRTQLTDIKGGEIQDAVLLGNYLVIYKQRSTQLMSYIGGTQIMGFSPLFTSAGIKAPRCACAIDSGKRHFCVGEDNIYAHGGNIYTLQYPIEEKDKSYLYADIDSTNYANSFAFDNPAFNEAWFCYPQNGQTYPNKALVWNYFQNRVTFRDFVGNAVDFGIIANSALGTWAATTSSWNAQTQAWKVLGNKRLIVADLTDDAFFGLDNGYPFGSKTTTAFLRRVAQPVVGKSQGNQQPISDYTSRKLVDRVWPKIRGNPGVTVNVRVGSQEIIGGTITWAPFQTFDPNGSAQFLDFTVSGRLPAFEFSSQVDNGWSIEGYDYSVNVLGDY